MGRAVAGYKSLARVLSALFTTQGAAWGTKDLIASMAGGMASNDFGSDCIGRAIAPLLLSAAREQGYKLLPRQEHPVVINTKGPSASGKSTLRPLQKKLAGDIGVQWSDFALISPDIWRKQLLDYASLGPRISMPAHSPRTRCRSSIRSSIVTWQPKIDAATCRTC